LLSYIQIISYYSILAYGRIKEKVSHMKNSITPISHFDYHDIVDDANDFVCIAEDELIVVTGYGLYFYNYTDKIVHYFFNFGELYAIELLDDTHVAFSGKIDDQYKLVLFNYQTKEVTDTQTIAFEAIQIKKINDRLLSCVGYDTHVVFYDFDAKEIVHMQDTKNHKGNFKRHWIQTIEIVDDEVIVYGGSDCMLSFFNHKTMKLLYTISRPGWIRDIEVFEDKLVATDGGSDKFAIWDHINRKYIFNDLVKAHHLWYICYLGDGDLIFGSDTPSLLNYKTLTLNQSCTPEELKDIEERVKNLTVVKENKFCSKNKWLYRMLEGVPHTSEIQKMMVLENGSFLIFFKDHFKEHMLLFYHTKKCVLWHVDLDFHVHKVIQLDESRLAFITTEQKLLIYDLHDKKIVFGYKIISVEDICKLDDKLLIYVTRKGMFSLNYKTYEVKDLSCFSIYDARELCRIDDERVVCVNGSNSFVCNVKSGEDAIKLHRSYTSFFKTENHLTLLDGEKIASANHFTLYIDNYNNGDKINTMKFKSPIQKLLKFDDEILFILEENGTLTPYNYKQDTILTQEIDLPYKSDIRDIIKLSDKHTAIQMRNVILIYEDILGERRCLESIKIYDNTILSLYTYEKEELTLINTQKPFLGKEDAYFDYYAKFIDLKSRKIFSYKELPQRVHFCEDEEDKVVLV